MNKRKYIKGSGILVVILSAIAFLIYSTTMSSEVQHFDNLLNKYIESNTKYYERYTEDIDSYYNLVLTDIKL